MKRLQPTRPTPPSKNGLNDRGNDGDGDVEMDDEDAAELVEALERPLAENPLLVTEAPGTRPRLARRRSSSSWEDVGLPSRLAQPDTRAGGFRRGQGERPGDRRGRRQHERDRHPRRHGAERSVQKSTIGGLWLSDQIRKMWETSDPKIDITPSFMVENKTPVEAGAPPNFKARTFNFPIHDSFRAYEEERLLTEFKESVVEVWRGPGSTLRPATRTTPSPSPAASSRCPTERTQMWREQRFRVAEGMWDEAASYVNASPEAAQVGKSQTIPALIKSSARGRRC